MNSQSSGSETARVEGRDPGEEIRCWLQTLSYRPLKLKSGIAMHAVRKLMACEAQISLTV